MKYCMIALITIIAGSVFAQTEISGEVSGVWTSDNSPYIVVDSTWIAQGDTLILSEGTRVEFQEGLGLDVWGRLISNGSGEYNYQNHNYIYVSEDVEHWRGLRFYGRNIVVMNYTSIGSPAPGAYRVPEAAIWLDDACRLTMNYSYIRAEQAAIKSLNQELEQYLVGCHLIFTDSNIDGFLWIGMIGGSVTADRSEFRFGSDEFGQAYGFSEEGEGNATCRFTNCVVYGDLEGFTRRSIVEYSRFLKPNRASGIGVSAGGQGGRMVGCYIEGFAHYDESAEPFKNNIVEGFTGNYFERLEVIDCDIRGRIGISANNEVIFRNSTLGTEFRASDISSLTIDSCYMVNRLFDGRNGFRLEVEEGGTELSITRSVIQSYFSFSYEFNGLQALFDHNTIIVDTTDRFWGDLSIGCEAVFTNNVFIAREPRERIFLGVTIESLPVFQYNCVSGFECVMGNFSNDSSVVYPVDSTNIFTDPLLDWYGLTPLLSHDSPCIDAGDPEASLDPDGTRSDIGNRAFHQWRNFVDSREKRLPVKFITLSAYPNPFNNTTTITFDLANPENVIASVFDIGGRKVFDVIDSFYSAGEHRVLWKPSGLSSGKYFILLKTKGEIMTFPITLVR